MIPLLLLTTLLPAAPQIQVESPYSGWNTDRIIEVKGRALKAERAVLVVNGSERPLQLNDQGGFKAVFLAAPGYNQISVMAWDKSGANAKKHVGFYAKAQTLDLVVMLYWDTDKTDVDLRIIEPSGEECFYGHRQTKSGGMLDVDDVDGYGPEVYTLSNAPHGEYRISVHYYSSHGQPQSLANVEVILLPGTDREERHRFEHMLTKTNDRVAVGTFTISPKGNLSIKPQVRTRSQ